MGGSVATHPMSQDTTLQHDDSYVPSGEVELQKMRRYEEVGGREVYKP